MLRMSEPQPKKPSHRYRLQTPSIPELANGMVKARLKLNERDVKCRGRKLKDGPLLNGLAAWFLALSDEEQERVARDGLARFEVMMGDRTIDEEEDGPDPKTLSGHGLNPPVKAPRSRRDKRTG